ncbi:MAG: Ig-like domain-containing protein [Nannocystaceae bacterium]
MRRAWIPLALIPLSLAPTAFAGDAGTRTLFGKEVAEAAPLSEQEAEARRLGFEALLEERGWVREDDVIGPPELFADAPPGVQAAWEQPPHRATIFLNFFGGEMSSGTNASLMQSSCIQGKVKYPGFSSSETKALAIIQTFQTKLEPYGVRVAYEEAPPPELPYQMVMMGGQPGVIGLPNGVLGVSCSSDCGDQWWRDTTFAFTEASGQSGVLATTALQEAAHAFGLAHIDGPSHIMYPYATTGDKVWADGCTVYNAATGGINCKPTHDIFCGGGSQDDNAELLAFFGVNSPDTVPPTVMITNPATDQNLEIGADVTIEAEVSDDYEGVGWKIEIYQNDVLVDERPAFNGETKWSAGGLPEAVYRFRVQAIDHDRNIGADERTIIVGNPPVMGTDTDTDGTGTDTGETTGDASASASAGTDATDGSAGTTGGMDVDDKGCNCRSDGGPVGGGAALLGLVGVLGLAGRRRRG